MILTIAQSRGLQSQEHTLSRTHRGARAKRTKGPHKTGRKIIGAARRTTKPNDGRGETTEFWQGSKTRASGDFESPRARTTSLRANYVFFSFLRRYEGPSVIEHDAVWRISLHDTIITTPAGLFVITLIIHLLLYIYYIFCTFILYIYYYIYYIFCTFIHLLYIYHYIIIFFIL